MNKTNLTIFFGGFLFLVLSFWGDAKAQTDLSPGKLQERGISMVDCSVIAVTLNWYEYDDDEIAKWETRQEVLLNAAAKSFMESAELARRLGFHDDWSEWVPPTDFLAGKEMQIWMSSAYESIKNQVQEGAGKVARTHIASQLWSENNCDAVLFVAESIAVAP